METVKKLLPPTHFEPEYLYDKYEPLRKATFARLKSKMPTPTDVEDLWCHIDMSFIELVNEYDPNRGVDFPFYIKRMLELRAYHFVSKVLNNVNRVSIIEEMPQNVDTEIQDLLDRIVDLSSLDPDIVLGEKHRKLMIGVFVEQKTLKTLAEEEGVPIDRLYARLYFLAEKFKKEHKSLTEIYGEDMY